MGLVAAMVISLTGCEGCRSGTDDTAATTCVPDLEPGVPLSTFLTQRRAGEVVEPAIFGMVRDTFAVSADNPRCGYRDSEGNDPVFHVVRPETVTDPGAARAALVWLHGGALGIDDECEAHDPVTPEECDDSESETDTDTASDTDEKDLCNFCRPDGIAGLVCNAVGGHEIVLGELARREWMMVVPENTWCDLWTGLGEDDPVDSNHRSIQHVEFVMDALEEGVGDLVADPDAEYLWGTSLGGSGAFPVAAGNGGAESRFDGIVSDSGPMAMAWWYDHSEYGPYLDHVAGGPPFEADGVTRSEHWANYARIDGSVLIAEGGFRVPVFSAYNEYDQLTGPVHGTQLEAVLDATYAPEGVRYWSQDFNHRAPAGFHHTQTPMTKPPWGYVARAAGDFLSGRSVRFLEAESLCPEPACDVVVADTTDSEDVDPHSIYSQGAAVAHGGDDTPGTVFSAELPADIARTTPITLLLAVAVDYPDEIDTSVPLFTATLQAEGVAIATKTVGVGEVQKNLGGTGVASRADFYVRHVDNTTWEFAQLPEGTLSLVIEHAGTGTLYLDGIWVIW